MKNKAAQELGKKGSDKRWATRYEILTKLAGYTNKKVLDDLMKWPTTHLEVLLKTYENKK